MKRLCAGLVMLGLFAVAACNQNNQPKGGTPPAPQPGKGGQFTIENPKSVSLTQGDQMNYTVTLHHEKDFTQAVTVTFNPPANIAVEPKEKKVEPDQWKKDYADITVKITATDKAPEGDEKIGVVAKPEKGNAIEKDIPIKIKAKK